jgi:deoxyribodipyrimidine photo-lyase
MPVQAMYWNRRHEPYERKLEETVRGLLTDRGIAAHEFEGNLLFGPEDVSSSTGGPYRVFTPFWHACRERARSARSAPPVARPLPGPESWPRSEPLRLPAVEPLPVLAQRLGTFLDSYHELRDRPDLDRTSKLSAALHFGEIGPRQLWQAVELHRHRAQGPSSEGAQAFLRQLAWREFAHHLLHHFPKTPNHPMRKSFEQFPWRDDEAAFASWNLGRTGYPIVDAGMRQLSKTGRLHNRVRLIASSFLVKHLLIDWRHGARHFWQTLEDADLANNTLGWQWISGCGVDAAPYFRIFNPVLQARRFDPHGEYTRRWVPELSGLGERWIHEPWAAPPKVLDAAGILLGTNYPRPVVELSFGRKRALGALAEISR